MNEKHSPAPWNFSCGDDVNDWPNYFPVIDNGQISIIGTEGFYCGDRDADIANAKLVSAAPELFALAKRISHLNRNAGEIGAGMLASLIDDANSAISKATSSN